MSILKMFAKDSEQHPRKTVLLVEENAHCETFLRVILEKQYDILTTTNREVAYKMAVNGKPDLIILTANLCGNKTVDLCMNLKGQGQTKGIPILVVADNGAAIVEYYFQEVEGFLIKPFSAASLLEHTEELIRNQQIATIA